MPGTVNLNPSSILYDENGNPVGVILDGSIYRLQTETKLEPGHGLATEATLDAFHANFENEDFAQETTLSGIDTTLTALEDRGQENMAGSLPVVVASDQSNIDTNVHDGSGNAITSEADGSLRRLHVEARFHPGQSIIIGNNISPDLGLIVRHYLETSGGSSSMKVDGSVTPVIFSFDADATYDIELYELRFIMGCQDILFEGNKFASRDELANGVKVDVIHNNGTSTEIANITINEDLLMFPTPANYILNNTGPKDILVMGLSLGGAPRLVAGSSDQVKVTIRDNLDISPMATFKAQVFGLKV